MLGFIPGGYRHAITDQEERWLHGDESARPANVVHVGPQVPEDMIDGAKTPDDALPLARIGPGGVYCRDIYPAALCEPATRNSKDGRGRRGWLAKFIDWVVGGTFATRRFL